MAKIIFPPRPKGRIPPTELPYYEGTGLWVAQYKYNGSRNVVHVGTDGAVSVWSRHGGKHLSYSIPQSVKEEILKLPGLKLGTEYWLDSELMSKTSAEDTKNLMVFFDVLQVGKYLFMKDQMTRLALLKEICGDPKTLDSKRQMGYVVSDTLLMAPTFERDFDSLFNEDHGDEVEGLLLRKKDAVLDNFGQTEYEVGWLLRCRKPHKNYNF